MSHYPRIGAGAWVDSLAMSRLAVFLCIVLNASIVFAPVGMHAHLDDHDEGASTVHSGHLHADEDEEDHDGDHVIDLHSTASVSSVHQMGKTPLLLLITLAPVLWILCGLILSVRLPIQVPACSAPSKQTYWRPPTRGPPFSLV